MKRKTDLFAKFKRKDFILIVCILCTGIILLLFMNSALTKGNTVRVTMNNCVTATYSLNENITEILRTEDGSYNTLVIENNAVYIREADCPDLICVKQHTINRVGETIVCLPHKLIVEIVDK